MPRRTDEHREPLQVLVSQSPEGLTTRLLAHGVEALGRPDTELELDEVASQLRELASDAVNDAARWIEASREQDPLIGWSLLYLLDLCELMEAEEVVDLFAAEAGRPIRRAEESCESEADLLELVAVQGGESLARLAARGNPRAREALLGVLESPDTALAVRLAAGRVAVTGEDEDLHDQVRRAMGEFAEALFWPVLDSCALAVEGDGEPVRGTPAPPLGRVGRGQESAEGAPVGLRFGREF